LHWDTPEKESRKAEGDRLVKIPLDHICVKSGILCPRCQALIEEGVVDSYEVDVMRALIEMEESSVRELRDVEYIKTYMEGNLVVIVLKGKLPPQVLSKIARNLSEKFEGRRVKVALKSRDLRQVASQVLYPARILGINTLWLPDGSVQYIIRVPRSEQRIIREFKEEFEKILSKIMGSVVEIRFE